MLKSYIFDRLVVDLISLSQLVQVQFNLLAINIEAHKVTRSIWVEGFLPES